MQISPLLKPFSSKNKGFLMGRGKNEAHNRAVRVRWAGRTLEGETSSFDSQSLDGARERGGSREYGIFSADLPQRDSKLLASKNRGRRNVAMHTSLDTPS